VTAASDPRPLRVAVLTGPFSTAQDTQLSALREHTGATVEIVYQRALPAAPFDDTGFRSLAGALGWDDEIPASAVVDLVDRLRPDVLLVTSWHHGAYVRIARAWRHRALRLMLMDNPWRSTGQAVGRHGRLEVVPEAGVRHRLPAERAPAGVRQEARVHRQPDLGRRVLLRPARFEVDRDSRPEDPQTFLSVGRLVASKGVDVLLQAYAAYRQSVEGPWPLHIAGTGPLAEAAGAAEGVVTLGFQQPAAMPEVFAGAGCFVLASIFEPWGFVIHEATASGLPIICTTACGASVDLVRNGYNGLTVAAGSVEALTDAMVAISTMATDRRREMGRASVSLPPAHAPAVGRRLRCPGPDLAAAGWSMGPSGLWALSSLERSCWHSGGRREPSAGLSL
jgi:glycosyltransferase involved in cell wall biosynthesis